MAAYTPAGAPKKSGAAVQTVVVLVVLAAVVVGAYFIFFRKVENGTKPPDRNGAVVPPENGTKPPAGNGEKNGTKPPPVVEEDVPGKAEFGKGEYKAAAEKLAEFVKKNGEHVGALYMLGQSYLKTGKTAEGEAALGKAMKLDPRGPTGGAAALSLGDSLYDRCYAKVEEQDRTKWERIREAYSTALRTAGYGPDRKQLITRLDKLNQHLIRSKMITKDSRMHTVLAGENVEKIGVAYGLPRDCTKSISRINKLKRDMVRPGQKIKVITSLRMEILVSKKHFTLTAWLNGYFFGEFPVGVGKGGATPLGDFVIKPTKGKDKKPTWYTTNEKGDPVKYPFEHEKNILGTRWMGFVDQPRIGAIGLGIHGTTDPKSIGTKSSAGCIRMLNKDVELLYDFTPGGTKVKVVN